MLDFIRDNVPRGSVLLADKETGMLLRHYLGGEQWPIIYRRGLPVVGGYGNFGDRLLNP